MDVLERLNRKFGSWYEGLFGGTNDRELRPRDILRRIIAAMEDNRREGLDGQIYVPNAYVLQIAVESDEERDYLHAFLDAEELSAAVRRSMDQHGYRIKGGLDFKVEEAPEGDPAFGDRRVHVRCRFDPSIPERPERGSLEAAASAPVSSPAPGIPASFTVGRDEEEDVEELGTVAAPFGQAGGGGVLATLLVQSADGRMKDAVPLTIQGISIGRSRRSGNDIVLREDPMVSKRHARIVHDGRQFVVYDHGSTNGTYVNGTTVDPGAAYPLEFGDEIQVGETTLLLRPAGQENGGSAAAPLPMRIGVVGGGFQLIAGDGEVFPLASSMTVGSALTNDIVVNASGVSGQHARVTVEGIEVYVEDLNTPGGTYVNGEQIPPLFPVALYDSHQVAFGQALFRLHRLTERGKLR